MDNDQLNRRQFLARSGTCVGAAWLLTNYPALAAAAEHAGQVASGEVLETFQTLSKSEAHLLQAITARIIPSEGEGPGAREAHVTVFIDRAFADALGNGKATFLTELDAFNKAFVERSSQPFQTADSADQDAFLATQETTPFFSMVHALTCFGMFASPRYGGNKDEVGWQLVGFEDAHAFAPPFGHYDRDYPGFEAVAERFRKAVI